MPLIFGAHYCTLLLARSYWCHENSDTDRDKILETLAQGNALGIVTIDNLVIGGAFHSAVAAAGVTLYVPFAQGVKPRATENMFPLETIQIYIGSKSVQFSTNRIEGKFQNLSKYPEVQKCFYSSKEELLKHQQKIMGKGLPRVKPIPGVKHIILVSSGKGGVGKSTTAVNLAASLKIVYPQKQIGLLDSDIFGPSIPLMMNLHDSPLLNNENLMVPLNNYGVKCMSMGFLVNEKSPIIWRGLMVMQALENLMRKVYWESIDYLIVDTPPGTGDTHLSLVQNLPIAGAILITTPSSASIQVTRKGGIMFQKLNVPIIGVVENMSYVTCSSCSNSIKLFGNGVEELAREFSTQVLIKMPLQEHINRSSDQGVPVVISNPKCQESDYYKTLAQCVNKFLMNRDLSDINT